MARPKISEPRDQQFNLSLTRAELESIRKRAEAIGMRPVHFGRSILLDEARTISVTRLTEDNGYRLAYRQLSRLGNLLNQAVRHCHRTGHPLPADLEPLLRDIRQILERRIVS